MTLTGYFNEYTLTVDIKRSTIIGTGIPSFVQNDDNYIHIRILNDGLPYDYSSADEYILSFKRVDGQHFYGNGTYADGLITYKLGSDELAVKGNVDCMVQLHLDGTRISSRPFILRSLEDFERGIESQEGYGLLQELFLEVEQSINSINDALDNLGEKASKTHIGTTAPTDASLFWIDTSIA